MTSTPPFLPEEDADVASSLSLADTSPSRSESSESDLERLRDLVAEEEVMVEVDADTLTLWMFLKCFVRSLFCFALYSHRLH